MDRRTFNKLAGFAALASLAENREMNAEEAAATAGEVVLADDQLLVAFDPASGALTRMEHKPTHWTIERRPALGVSFRMLVPLPNRRSNFILGQKQRATSVEKISANQVRLVWKNLESEHGGMLPITFTATVKLENGALTFDCKLANESSYTVETIDYPYFGDLNPPAPGTPMQVEHMWTGALQGEEIYPHFSGPAGPGYWGVRYPTKSVNSNQSQFCLIQSPAHGIYAGMHDPEQPYFLQFTFEQHPGILDWDYADVPRGDELAGTPVHLEFRACHFLFAHAGSSKDLAPVVLRPYAGDWHAGLDVYKQWRTTWYPAPKLPEWSRDVHSWLQLQIDGAEQDYSIPYNKLVEYGEECAQHGVGAIQLVGWSKGGQDGGDPSLDTDPGLGTWDELHNAIAANQARGVKMILFGKPYFADLSTEQYKKELHRYASTDPYGNIYETSGYSYTTPTQLAGINNRRRAIMDVCCQEYRDIATREFKKTLALGSAGWLFDEVLWHGGILYSFSPDHGYEAPGYLFNGDIPLVKQFHEAANEVNPDFLFAGEGPGEWLLPYYPFGYYRIGFGTRPALRYLDSQVPLMAAVRGFDDREMLNVILAYRYIISYEPYYFKGRLTDFPLTLAYGKKIDALRRRYREFLWDAEFRDSLGAQVIADGDCMHTVFRTAAGKRAVVVVNKEFSKAITAKLDLPDLDLPNAGKLVLATPEDPDARPCSGALRIPARSAVVIMEQ
jgi:hypothetical protein